MGRGVFAGGLAGLVVSVAVFSVVSLLFPPPGVPLAPGVTTAPVAPAAATGAGAAPATPAALADRAPTTGGAPAVVVPEARATLPGTDSTPIKVPTPGAPAPGATPAPDSSTVPSLADVGAASPPNPTPPPAIGTPEAPATLPGAGSVVVVLPSAPAAPGAPVAEPAPVLAPQVAGATPAAPAPGMAGAPRPDTAGAEDKGTAPPDAGVLTEVPGTARAEAPPPTLALPPTAPQAGANPDQPQPVQPPEPAPGPMESAMPGLAPPPTNPPAAGGPPKTVELLDPAHPQIIGLKPVPGVKVNRLPQVGIAAPAETLPGAVAAPLTDNTAAAPPQVDPPVRRYAVAAHNPENKPALAVILIDNGSASNDRRALAASVLPVSFAVDPTAATAEDAARTYRDGGHEVLVLATAIPKLSTPSDLAQTFAAYFRTVPEAVGVIDVASGGFRDNRMMAQRIVAILSDGGYGMVTYDGGLNAAAQLAGTNHMPSARVFASLDGSADAMSRALDRAAFRAAQEGGATVVAPASADTLAALSDWLRGPRGAAVALVPVTAVMRN